jgi:hypothetical protein
MGLNDPLGIDPVFSDPAVTDHAPAPGKWAIGLVVVAGLGLSALTAYLLG